MNDDEGLPRVRCSGKEEEEMDVTNSGTGIDMDIRVMGSIGKGRPRCLRLSDFVDSGTANQDRS